MKSQYDEKRICMCIYVCKCVPEKKYVCFYVYNKQIMFENVFDKITCICAWLERDRERECVCVYVWLCVRVYMYIYESVRGEREYGCVHENISLCEIKIILNE